MLCEQCEKVLREPQIFRDPVYGGFGREAARGWQVLHETYSSFQVALDTKCGICHRVNALSLRKSKLLSEGRLSERVEASSFSVQYKIALGSSSHTVLVFQHRVIGKLEGKLVRELRNVPLFLAPGS